MSNPKSTTPVTGARTDASQRRLHAFVLGATILASAMAFIDGSVVTIALPVMQRELGADLAGLQWIVNAYTLMLGALLLVGGGLGDRIGRRRVFIGGICAFAAASALCAVAPTLGWLIAGRALQGLGAAALVPQSLAIISATFPREVRGRAIGAWAAASAVTTALGPPVGGFLIDAWSWRAAFWINIPLSAAAVWMTLAWVPESRDEGASGRVDATGAGVAVIAFGALTLGLTWIAGDGGGRLAALAAVAVGAAGLAAFVAIERRARNPIMPLGLFRSRTFAVANIVTLFLYGSLSGLLFLLPFDLIGRRGLSATGVGLSLLPLGLVIGLLSRPAGALADRHGPRLFLAAGSALVGLCCLWLALGMASYWIGVFAPIAGIALGMSLAVSPLTTAVMNAVPDRQAGAASGVNNAASRLAGLLAVAILGAIVEIVFRQGAPGASFADLAQPAQAAAPAMQSAFRTAYATGAAIAGLSALLAAFAATRLPPGIDSHT